MGGGRPTGPDTHWKPPQGPWQRPNRDEVRPHLGARVWTESSRCRCSAQLGRERGTWDTKPGKVHMAILLSCLWPKRHVCMGYLKLSKYIPHEGWPMLIIPLPLVLLPPQMMRLEMCESLMAVASERPTKAQHAQELEMSIYEASPTKVRGGW